MKKIIIAILILLLSIILIGIGLLWYLNNNVPKKEKEHKYHPPFFTL